MSNPGSGFRTWMAMGVLALVLPWQAVRAGAADTPSSMVWVTPVIAGFGKVHPRPDAAVQPDPSVDYRIFVRVTDDGKRPAERMPALDRRPERGQVHLSIARRKPDPVPRFLACYMGQSN